MQLPADLVGNAHPFFYADPYTEQQLLQQAALKQTGQLSFINGLAWDDQNNVSVATQQKAILYQNGADFATANGLKLGQALSPELQAKLDAPMLWYVEQQVPDGHGGSINALVPTVYLPDASRAQLTNMAGGDIHGQNVSLTASDAIKNTGTLRADDTLSISAKEFTNQKRLGDIGRYTEATEGGYLDISGEKVVQEGAFVSAANLQIQADKIASVSGTFELVGATAADTQARSAAYLAELQAKMGSAFEQSIAKDNLHIEAHIGGGMGVTQVIAIVVAVVVAYFTAGAASGLIASAFNAGAGSFMGAAVAATAATSTTAATAAVSAGLGNIMLSGAIAGMASSATSQLITTGKINGSQTLKAGLVQGLTAGIAGGLASRFGGTPGTAVAGTSTVATNATTTLGSRIVGALELAAASSIAQTLVYGKGGGSAFTSSLLASVAAFGANEIGAQNWGEAGRALAHAGLGCAVAAAGGKDCGSGALGGAMASLTNPYLDSVTGLDDSSRRAGLMGLQTLTTGLAALATGMDVNTAIGAAQNETTNNYLEHSEHVTLQKAENACAGGDKAACGIRDQLRQLDVSQNKEFQQSLSDCRSSDGCAKAINNVIRVQNETSQGIKTSTDNLVVDQYFGGGDFLGFDMESPGITAAKVLDDQAILNRELDQYQTLSTMLGAARGAQIWASDRPLSNVLTPADLFAGYSAYKGLAELAVSAAPRLGGFLRSIGEVGSGDTAPLVPNLITPYGTTLADETATLGKFSQNYAGRTYQGLNININERGLLAQERTQAEAAGWIKPDGSTWWPPYDGAIPGTQRMITYKPSPGGSPLILVDRYGRTSGSYVSPAGVPLDARALSSTPTSPPSVYSVDGVIEGVERANAAGWFGQRGTGIQDKLPGRVQYYLDTGKFGEQ